MVSNEVCRSYNWEIAHCILEYLRTFQDGYGEYVLAQDGKEYVIYKKEKDKDENPQKP